MKIFQQLLVAPAALGLLIPLNASAAEFNLRDVSNYSDIEEVESITDFSEVYPSDWAFQAITDVTRSRGCSALIPKGTISRFEAAQILNSCVQDVAQLTELEARLVNEFRPELSLIKARVDNLENRVNEFEAGSFSDTTTASFSADFAVGSLDGLADKGEQTLQGYYSYGIDLSSSFTGEDSFDVSIIAGNTGGAVEELDLNSTSDKLTMDGISYTFPVGEKTTVFFGNGVDGSSLYSTACVYGGPSNTLDDCGNVNAALAPGFGTAAGASYEIGDGWTAAFGYEGQGADADAGLLTDEGTDAYGGQLAYSTDSYGVSATYGIIEADGVNDSTYWAFNGYWIPTDNNSIPSVSIGTEYGDHDTTVDTTSWFIGLTWEEFGPGSFGAAIGTKEATLDNADEELMYEAYYSYPLNDAMTITPLLFVKENSEAGTDDVTGIMVKTSFSF